MCRDSRRCDESAQLEWGTGAGPLDRPVLFFDGLRIVHAFGPTWNESAAGRMARLAARYPEHRGKYEWLVRLYKAVSAAEALTSGA